MEKVYDTVTKRVFTIYEPFKIWVLNFESGRYIKVPPNGKLPLSATSIKSDNNHY